MHRLKKSDCELVKGEFVITRVRLGLFIRNPLLVFSRLLNIIVREVQEKVFRPIKFVNLLIFSH